MLRTFWVVKTFSIWVVGWAGRLFCGLWFVGGSARAANGPECEGLWLLMVFICFGWLGYDMEMLARISEALGHVSEAKVHVSEVLGHVSEAKVYVSEVIGRVSGVKVFDSEVVAYISEAKVAISEVKVCISE